MRMTTLVLCFAMAASPSAAQSQAPLDVMEKTITELQNAMTAGTLTSRQLVEAYLARIGAYDKQGPTLNALVAINPEASAIADGLDAERKAGKVRGPLHGIPVLVKDNYETVDMPTSAGSIALATFHPRSDAFMMKKLRDAGAVILGKTNMHELAMSIVPLSVTQDIGGPLARTTTDLAIMLDATVGADATDPITKGSAGNIPKSYRELLRVSALKGARIGVVRALFGTAPEDQEVTGIVNKAIDAMKKSGAEVIDIVIPGLDELLTSSSVINAEFKFDFMEYLARHPEAPVKSLGEILDRGLYHAALETTFRLRNAPEKRETDQYRIRLIRRDTLRAVVASALAEQHLAAVVYPTLRRKPGRIGDAQGGTNCMVSAHSGLPSLCVPAGFTDDGLPVGMDLLGPAWSEATLLSLGFSIEETLKLRRAPFSTPALVDGKAPAPKSIETSLVDATGSVASLKLTYDALTSRLSYYVNIGKARESDLIAIWIHRLGGAPRTQGGGVPGDGPGAALHPLYGGATPPNGSVVLSFSDRNDLTAGRLRIRYFTRQNPSSTGTDRVLRFS